MSEYAGKLRLLEVEAHSMDKLSRTLEEDRLKDRMDGFWYEKYHHYEPLLLLVYVRIVLNQ